VIDVIDSDQTWQQFWDDLQDQPAVCLVPIGWLLATAWTMFVMRAANAMRRYRRYWAAVAAAVMTMFSVPFVYLAVVQFPIAVWVLLVLSRRDVRARFEAVARGTMVSGHTEATDARADRPA